MQKTKLGISVPLLAAAVCFAAVFGGYVATIILTGYVLLKEEDEWLRKTSVKALAVMMLFSFISTIVGFVPDIVSILNNLCTIFNTSFEIKKLSQIIYLIKGILTLVESIILIIMGYKALKYTEMNVAMVDKIVDNNM
jgi:uncharacterized membrane protein